MGKKNNVVSLDKSFFNFNTAPTVERLEHELKRVRASLSDSMGAFKEHLAKHGLCPDQIVPDGKRHRFPVDGDTGNEQSGWYIFYGDNWPAGAFGCWRGSLSIDKAQSTWAADRPLDDSSPADDAARRERIAEMSRIREEQQQAFYAEGRERASEIWSSAHEAEDHPYLKAKGVKGYGLRVERGALCIPAYTIDGTLRGLQRIYWDAKDGSFAKRFSEGTEKRGSFAHIPGETDRIIIGEGYATMATIREATGATCIVAWDCGNLTNVAKAWRERMPDATIIIAGDNDPNGAGQKHAKEAADAIGARCIIADVSGVPGGTDFNDVAAAKGVEEVTRQFAMFGDYRINILECSYDEYDSPAPEHEWLVQGILPLGALVVLAAAGGTGKGIATLDLGLQVAGAEPDPACIDLCPPMAFGNRIVRHGPVVLMYAEDCKKELHRRIQGAGRPRPKYPFHPVPVVDKGGVKPLFINSDNGIQETDEWREWVRQIKAIRPVLVVIDPMSSFMAVDINSKPEVGQQVQNKLAALASELNCSIIIAHHMNKSVITSAEEARNAIRGTSGLVDGARGAYAMWPLLGRAETRAKRICHILDIEYKPKRVVMGALVKDNFPGDTNEHIYVRNDNGLLVERSEQIKALSSDNDSIAMDILLDAIEEQASAGNPFTVSGRESGLFERNYDLPEELRSLGRDKIRALAERLLVEKKLVKCAAKGSKTRQFLDVPNGNFAVGLVS